MMGTVKKMLEESMLYCDNCHCFNGTEDECVKDGDGGLYCPICDTLVGYETQPEYAKNTGLKFQDYIDYLNQKDIIEHTLNKTIHVLKMNDVLSFDNFDSKNENHIKEILTKDISDYFDVGKQTKKQRRKIASLEEYFKELYPSENMFNHNMINQLNDMQASKLIDLLSLKIRMKEMATIKQIKYLNDLENKYKHYHFFDDKLNLSLAEVLDNRTFVSKFEMSERIGVMVAIEEYVNGITSDIIPETHILYDIFIDKVKEWKGLNKHDD